ncbi:MAG: hypothetical protein U1E56_02520 [Bauldia sp.]
MALHQINCLWVGPRLTSLEQLCLLSMVRTGHRVRLFGYQRYDNVPAEVEQIDAREILPETGIVIHTRRRSPIRGTPAPGADIFRYRLLERGLGLWADLDLLLIKPVERTGDYVFGRGLDATTPVLNGVLDMPKDSKLLRLLLDFVANPYPVPPFYSLRRRAELVLRKILGIPKGVGDMTSAVLGPELLSYLVVKLDLMQHALPAEVFYPLPHRLAQGPFIAGWDVESLIKPNTVAVHLWNDKLRRPTSLRPDNPSGRLLVDEGSWIKNFAARELDFDFVGD